MAGCVADIAVVVCVVHVVVGVAWWVVAILVVEAPENDGLIAVQKVGCFAVFVVVLHDSRGRSPVEVLQCRERLSSVYADAEPGLPDSDENVGGDC
eukprot:CFRG0109T1